jgi:hypothetical protein
MLSRNSEPAKLSACKSAQPYYVVLRLHRVFLLSSLSSCGSRRSKEEKKNRVKEHSNVVVIANSRELAAERSSSARCNDKSVVVKKRKLHDIAYVPTIADLPSHELLDYKRCKRLLNLQTFFIAGFSPEVSRGESFLLCIRF